MLNENSSLPIKRTSEVLRTTEVSLPSRINIQGALYTASSIRISGLNQDILMDNSPPKDQLDKDGNLIIGFQYAPDRLT
jgi:hypothetical protein